MRLLEDLAATMMTEVGLRRKAREACEQGRALKAARQAIHAEREQYLQLVHGLDGIDWEGDARTWSITVASRQTEAILGNTPHQGLDRSDCWTRILHSEDRERIVAASTPAIEAERDHRAEYRGLAADGRVVWIRDLVRVIRDETGAPARIRGIMVDITVEKEAVSFAGTHFVQKPFAPAALALKVREVLDGPG